MKTPLHTILEEALELPPIDRAKLIEELLESFEFRKDKNIETLWAKEAESRVKALEEGKLSTRPIKEVFNEINKLK